jgi:hypothetical protein
MRFRRVLHVIVCITIVVVSACATTVNLSTGQNGGGVIQSANGAVDANWFMMGNSLVSNGTHAQVVATNGSPDWYSGWTANDSNSAWIAANASVCCQGAAPYSYEFQFTLTAAQAATASLSAATWGIDDHGTLQLNGNIISGPFNFNSNPGGINSFAGTSTGFVTGVNTLAIVMDSTDNNLEGARYNGTLSFTATATPEPASAFLMLSGLAAGLFALRRRS